MCGVPPLVIYSCYSYGGLRVSTTAVTAVGATAARQLQFLQLWGGASVKSVMKRELINFPVGDARSLARPHLACSLHAHGVHARPLCCCADPLASCLLACPIVRPRTCLRCGPLMGWWDPFAIEKPTVGFVPFLIYQIGFIAACWSLFALSTGMVKLPIG